MQKTHTMAEIRQHVGLSYDVSKHCLHCSLLDRYRHLEDRELPESEVGATPSPSNIEGMQRPHTMAELQAAIYQAKVSKASGPDGLSYDVFKSMHSPALQWLLDTLTAIWKTGELPES
ncbi:hypothetical protein HPB51_021459 [Rhipicephalus microplus]|uniref:Uncharacterized protein n=1 Tax=Rhipicephalus microplus TaxID=6941 RepID=A0A9J6EUM3_RHIMP|nr:hypothetical protein HPB51_021459 [Rhipicephalus microplus]